MTPHDFVALVPVKPTDAGKSRLTGLGARDRSALARAFALDTVAACLASAHVVGVVVVTDDETVAAAATGLGAEVAPDPGAGLNAALRSAASVARSHHPGSRPVAVLADLPALRADELTAVLAAAPAGAAYVPDAEGTGTTLYTAPYELFAPEYGGRSASAHERQGAVRLDAGASVRRDVDTPEDWAEALAALGVGPHTRSVLTGAPPA